MDRNSLTLRWVVDVQKVASEVKEAVPCRVQRHLKTRGVTEEGMSGWAVEGLCL